MWKAILIGFLFVIAASSETLKIQILDDRGGVIEEATTTIDKTWLNESLPAFRNSDVDLMKRFPNNTDWMLDNLFLYMKDIVAIYPTDAIIEQRDKLEAERRKLDSLLSRPSTR